MIWDPYLECMDVEQRAQLQVRRLRDTVARLAVNVPHYRSKFKELGINAEDIRSLDDLRRLPFTEKDDLRDNYPYGLFAVPMEEIVRLHASSGTTGKPTVVGYSASDIETWAECTARAIGCAGGSPHDILHVSYGYGLFTGGLGLHYGGERMGCTVLPMSAGNTERQLMMMVDMGSTILACTPSYALTLADAAKDHGVGPDDLKLKSGIVGAEPWSEGSRNAVEQLLGLSAHDIYGISEVMGPGVSMECDAKNGLHVFDDHFIPEIVNPETGEPVPDGEYGELVFTCITKRCLPLIRYRTRDVSCLQHGVCSCGRTHPRMGRIRGRTDDMLIIRGVNVFPSQIEHVLLGIEEAQPHYQLIVRREGRLDVLEVQVEVAPELLTDTVRRLQEVENKIAHAIYTTLGISVDVKLVEPKTLARSEGKAKRVLDLREGV
ncbi:MAG: phenylacetate--CoA ligase [Armatimonadia bacterium]